MLKLTSRHYIIVMTFGVFCGVGLSFIIVALYGRTDNPDVTTDVSTKDIPQFSLIRSAPVSLQISKINLDTDFVTPLFLNEDKTVSVPDSYTKVGWYSGGVSPGENGPAVILGHVDSHDGPAVFYSLGQLKVGDEINIDRADGTELVFVVTELARYSQNDFPTQLVYGAVDYPALRLVTCTGIFDKQAQKYSHNLVVYAVLKIN